MNLKRRRRVRECMLISVLLLRAQKGMQNHVKARDLYSRMSSHKFPEQLALEIIINLAFPRVRNLYFILVLLITCIGHILEVSLIVI